MTTDLPAEQDARTRILDCALGLMSERGSAGTSMRRLAAASGLNVATIYHYFPSKADVLKAVIDERRYGERLTFEKPAIDPALPAGQRFTGLLGWMWAGTLEEQAVLRLLVGEGLRSEAAAQQSARGLIVTLEASLAEWFSTGFPELAARDTEPDLAARLVMRNLLALIIEQLATGSVDFESAAADLAALLFP